MWDRHLARLQHSEQIRAGPPRSKGWAADRRITAQTVAQVSCVSKSWVGGLEQRDACWPGWMNGVSCCGASLVLLPPLSTPPRLAACTLSPAPLPSHGSLPWPLDSTALVQHAPHSITMIVSNHTQDHVVFLHKSSPASLRLSRQAPPSFPLSPLLPCGSSSLGGWTSHTHSLPCAFEPAVPSTPVPFPFSLTWWLLAYLQSPL